MIRSETTAALPDTAETTSPLPGVATTSGRLPRQSETTLPSGMIPKFPPRTYAAFTGEGVFAAAAGAGVKAQFAGVGSLAVTGVAHAFATAAFSGSGALAANVLNQSALAQFSGTGTLSVAGRPTAAAGFSGTGSLSAKANAVAKAQFSGAGTLSAVARVSATAPFSGAGSLSAVAQTTIPMGMDKVNTQSLPGGAYTKITNWTPRSGYPDTDIFNDGLRLRPGIYSSIAFTATIENNPRQLRLQVMKNGVQIAFSDSGGSVITWPCTASNVTIVLGDLITFEVNPTAGRVLQPGSTYVVATPA